MGGVLSARPLLHPEVALQAITVLSHTALCANMQLMSHTGCGASLAWEPATTLRTPPNSDVGTLDSLHVRIERLILR